MVPPSCVNEESSQLKIHKLYVETLTYTKSGARCELSPRRLIALTVFKIAFDSEEHQDIISQFVSMLEGDERYFLLQQGGATSYTIDFFKDCFDSRLISKHLWFSRSPDLAPIDFFL